jgi:hypothetical protein
MTTRLDKPLKRELAIAGKAYRLTITPTGFALVLKGHRKGQELRWIDLVSGDAALATALNASLAQATKVESVESAKKKVARKKAPPARKSMRGRKRRARR